MASVRDPGRDAMEAEELARARLSAAQDVRQVRARRVRNRALVGQPAARKALAKDYAAVNVNERLRAGRPATGPIPPPMATRGSSGMWVGEGPPPADPLAISPDVKPGDEYLDSLTGIVYTLE